MPKRESSRKWAQANKQYYRDYYKKNREEMLRKARLRYAAKRDEINAKARERHKRTYKSQATPEGKSPKRQWAMEWGMRSGFERTLATQMKVAGVKYEYETLKLPYTINHVYIPDFILPNGIIVEAKGYFRPGDVAKYRAVKKYHPDMDIRFVFQDADKKIPGQKQTHGEWCKRHGFPYASGRIPADWLK